MTTETREALKEFARATKWAIAEADIDLTKYCLLEDSATRLIRALEQERDRVALDPFGCHKHVAQWLEAGKYRTLAHRHDGTFAAVDEAEQRKMRADTLPLLSDALLNWKQEATWLKS